jgi:hypothetical protein
MGNPNGVGLDEFGSFGIDGTDLLGEEYQDPFLYPEMY